MGKTETGAIWLDKNFYLLMIIGTEKSDDRDVVKF